MTEQRDATLGERLRELRQKYIDKGGRLYTADEILTELNGLDVVSALSETACSGLTFDAFRRANVTRCLKWHPAGIESWSSSDWLTAVTGELGELASLLKMRNRERDGLPGNKFSPTSKQVADELADVLTYLDLLAAALGVDLGSAAIEKFNEVSVRVGFPDRIETIPSAIGQSSVAVPRDLFLRLELWTRQVSQQPASRVATGIANAAVGLNDELRKTTDITALLEIK